MARDLAIFEAAEKGIPGGRIYSWDGPWVTLGRFQRPEEALVNPETTDWVTRPTGGQAVLHGHDVTLGLALPLTEERASRSVKAVYAAVTKPLIEALSEAGISAVRACESGGARFVAPASPFVACELGGARFVAPASPFVACESGGARFVAPASRFVACELGGARFVAPASRFVACESGGARFVAPASRFVACELGGARCRRPQKAADCFAQASLYDIVDAQTGLKVCGCALRLSRKAVLLQASIPAGEPLVDPAQVIRGASPALVAELDRDTLTRGLVRALSRLSGL